MTKLVNIRLDEKRLRKVRVLRENGVALSAIVREAIDGGYDRLSERTRRRNMRSMVAEILAQHPEPDKTPRRSYDVHDARQAREEVRKKLRPRR